MLLVIRVMIIYCAMELRIVYSKIPEKMFPPNYMHHHKWLEQHANYHLTKMTTEIYRDATTKMKIVKVNSKFYAKNRMYAVGVIASSVYTSFEQMINIYQDAADLYTTRGRDYYYNKSSLTDSVVGFGLCQSLYHRIRLEVRLFKELMKLQGLEADRNNEAFMLMYGQPLPGSEKNPTFPKGGMYVDRRNIADDLFDEDDFDRNFEIPILSKLKNRKNKNITIGNTLPRNPHALPKLNPYKMTAKPASKYTVSNEVPPDFNQPMDPNVLKLMSQLNKDNPKLNPDLDSFLRHSYRAAGVNAARDYKFDELSVLGSKNYAVESRRMGSRSYTPAQSPKRPDPIQTQKLTSTSYAAKLRRMTSESYAVQKRRMASNGYTVQQMRSESYASSQPLREFNRHRAGHSRMGDYYESKKKRKSYSEIGQWQSGADSYANQQREFDRYQSGQQSRMGDHSAVQPQKQRNRYSKVGQSQSRTDSYAYQPREFDRYRAGKEMRLGSDYFPFQTQKKRQRNGKIDSPRFGSDNFAPADTSRLLRDYKVPPMDRRRSLRYRGRLTTRTKKLRWKPKII